MHIDASEMLLETRFLLQYTDRDSLTEDEILQEGFTENDDYEWKGNLNDAWFDTISKLADTTKINEYYKENATVVLKIDGSNKFSPNNTKAWEDLLQDLIQAVFEQSGKEKPWEMKVHNIVNGKAYLQDITILFAEKKVAFGRIENKIMHWEAAKKLMQLIYLGDFIDDKITSVEPKKDGLYLSFAEGFWYELGFSVLNPNGNKGYLEKLKKEILSLF